jgi:NTE family protein
VLRYILDVLPKRLGRRVRFDIVTGTSVGAVHACYVAGMVGQREPGRPLADIWQSLSAENVYNLGVADMLSAPLKMLGFGAPAWGPAAAGEESADRLPGVLNTEPLETLVRTQIPWANIRRHIDSGTVSALAVAATEISTGRTVVFVDNASGEVDSWAHDPFVEARAAHIGPRHAIASAAIPLLSPLVRVNGAYYCDGGLRLNTPLAPALRLGADRVLVIALRPEPRLLNGEQHDPSAGHREADFTRPTYLAGKVLDALLLDHVDYDLDRLRLFNAILTSGKRAYGNAFLKRINEPITARRGLPYRIVRELCIRPSRDLGEIAFECAENRPWAPGLRAYLTGAMVRYVARGTPGEGDLLSYVLFDHSYAEQLINLGMTDAEACRDELVDFFS